MSNITLKIRSGYSLMEVMVSLFIIMIIMLGVYSLVLLYLNLNEVNTYYIEAVEIANQKMERIRNMPYAEIGVVGGIPNGTILQQEYVRKSNTYKVQTYITFYDDYADGHAASSTPDPIPNDYKIASVKVTWSTKAGDKHITVFSKIIPRTVETNEGYGLLKISVSSANAQPIKNARVHIVNNQVVPPIDVLGFTDNKGILYQPATSSYQGYEIYVSKTDEEPAFYYGHDQTYGTSTSKSPFHLSVTEGNMTAESFTIDKLANLQIKTITADLPDNWKVNQTDSYREETNPHISLDATDNMYFAWQSRTGTSSFIRAQKFDSLENKQWASDISISTTEHQANPDIVTSAAGNSFIVWQDNSPTLKSITRGPGSNFLASAKNVNKTSLPDWPYTTLTPTLEFSSPETAFIFTSIPAITNDSFFIDYFDWLNGSNIFISKLFDKDLIKNAFSLVKNSLVINNANAVGSIVQTKISSNVGSGWSLSTSFNSPPTAGNVLLAIGVHRNASNSFGTPYNSDGDFTESVYSNTSWSLDVGIWHKVAGASEPQTVTLPCNGSINGGVLMLLEISGLDVSDLVDQISENPQVSGDSFSATTGFTPVSTDSGFAVAAVAFADNDFTTANSSNWSSASSDTWSHQLWNDWWVDNDGTLAVATMDVTSASQQMATLTLSGSDNEERNSVMVVFNLFDPDDVNLIASGTQIASATPATSNVYIGGSFVFTDMTGSRNITEITITENGTIDAQNDLDNIKLFYDLDTSFPYDCVSESYNGTEAQFGATDTSGFNAVNGTSTFSGNLPISTTQTACVYVVLDVGSGAEKYQSIDIKIDDPLNDVVLSAGTLMTGATILLSGSTLISVPPELHQSYYRWRYDNGDEEYADWRELENTGSAVTKQTTLRLRFKIVNAGSEEADATAYRIEYGEKITSCSAASWTALPNDDTQHWRTDTSTNYSDGASTTEQMTVPIGTSFTPGQIKTDDDQTIAYKLAGDNTTELEYAISATANVSDSPYCFRLTNAGTPLDNYDIYPEITIIGDENVYIISLDSLGNTLWAIKRINSDNSNANQSLPRIALVEDSGIATSVVVWQDDRSGNENIYAQSFDASGNKLWNSGNDLQLTSSSTDETAPVVAIDQSGNVYVAWTDQSATIDRIYMQKYSLASTPLWASPQRMVISPYDVNEPQIDIDSAGNTYLTYTETIIGISSTNIASYAPSGAMNWEARANQEAITANQYSPDCAVDDTNIYITWTDDRESNNDVYAQKFDLSGTALWPEDLLISITTGSSTQENSSVVINSSAKAYAVWQDERSMDYEIYATYFKEIGALTPATNVPLTIRGSKTISDTPIIYEYNKVSTTNGSGEIDLMVEFDTLGYYIDVVATATPYVVELMDPVQPLRINPDETIIWNIYLK